ncbi:annexin A13-like isoform X2 [Paramacrobiotus metropolitanus]|uniref:annexin A13-like isoform X2 n=1 Tax=Paramacrobiotus metropolitanus TaxID=2943436 RepID=UPI002446462D|nr:annexin A13-like isoform X2 [Paramacrobiotus metropolitanus]
MPSILRPALKKMAADSPDTRRRNLLVEFEGPADVPTIVGSSFFDAEAEAKALHEALKGFAKNKVVMDILTSHNNGQRRSIVAAYHRLYNKELASTIKHELNIMGHYEQALLALLLEPAEYDARELHHALSGPFTDHDTVIEILCSRNNKELLTISANYYTLYHKELESIIRHDTKGEFEHLLLALLSAHREENQAPDLELADKDADELYQAETTHWAGAESSFTRILSSRSYRQLLITFRQFEKLANEDIEEAIKKNMHGELRALMLSIVKFVKNRHEFFAECLYKSMKGLGTNDHKLIRIIVGRCEKDLGNIKAEFQKLYNKTLESFIEGDTSGNYKHILLALVGVPHHQLKH